MASGWDSAQRIRFNREVKISGFSWNSSIIEFRVGVIGTLSIIPVSVIASSVVSDGVVTEAVVGRGCAIGTLASKSCHRSSEDTFGSRSSGIDRQWNLSNEGISPCSVTLVPCCFVASGTPRISHEEHLMNNVACIFHLESCENGVGMTLSNTTGVGHLIVSTTVSTCSHDVVGVFTSFEESVSLCDS